MSASTARKILRVGVIQGGKIIEERHLRRPDDVSVGPDARNTFVVPTTDLPTHFKLFEHKGDRYQLVFTEQMQGRVSVGTSDLDFNAVRSQGLAPKRGDVFVLPLDERSRGKVTVGDVTLLFQFVIPPAEPVAADLPKDVRGNVWQSMDRFFFGVLAASLLVHFTGATWIVLSPTPEEPELSLEELPDRFAKVLIPQQAPEPEKVVEAVAAPEAEKEKEKPKEAAAEKPKSAAVDTAARRAEVVQKVASKGLLKILGSAGGGGGAFEDVLGGSTGAGEIASALQGAGGVGVATEASLGSGGARGGGTGNVAGIGDLGTSGGGKVDLGGKKEVQVTGRVKDATPEVEGGDVDRDALARYVKARLKAIQNCYEKELKRNPSLKGKVVVRFNILTSGRTGDVEVEENSLGNEAVGSCIRAVIRSWVFPFKPDDEVPVAYPFVFSPAG